MVADRSSPGKPSHGVLLHLLHSHYSRKDSPCAADDDAVRLRQVKGVRLQADPLAPHSGHLSSSNELSHGVLNSLAPLYFCSFARPGAAVTNVCFARADGWWKEAAHQIYALLSEFLVLLCIHFLRQTVLTNNLFHTMLKCVGIAGHGSIST